MNKIDLTSLNGIGNSTIFKIEQSINYDKFKDLHGNREKNKAHIERLKKSFLEQYLLSPILINEKFEIIDGQHRFEAAKELNYPIYYIIVKGYDYKEVQVLNTNSIQWCKKDFMNAYCELKKPAYIILRNFLREFPKLGFQLPIKLLSGIRNRRSENGIRQKDFEEGKLEIVDLDLARQTAKKIMDIKEFYKGYNRREFAFAMIDIFNNKNYKHKEFLSKLQKFPNKLHNCTKIEEYKELIEYVYNYKRVDKVSLRY